MAANDDGGATVQSTFYSDAFSTRPIIKLAGDKLRLMSIRTTMPPAILRRCCVNSQFPIIGSCRSLCVPI